MVFLRMKTEKWSRSSRVETGDHRPFSVLLTFLMGTIGSALTGTIVIQRPPGTLSQKAAGYYAMVD